MLRSHWRRLIMLRSLRVGLLRLPLLLLLELPLLLLGVLVLVRHEWRMLGIIVWIMVWLRRVAILLLLVFVLPPGIVHMTRHLVLLGGCLFSGTDCFKPVLRL